jgi:arsenate reductase
MINKKKNVLFLCYSNSCRSQIAEGFLKAFLKDEYESFSAGIQPTSVNPYAIEVMKEIGIDISDQYSKSVDEFQDKKFDYVVTVCDTAKEKCPFYHGKQMIHKNFEDPSEIDGNIEDVIYEFRKLRDEIKRFIKETFGVGKL